MKIINVNIYSPLPNSKLLRSVSFNENGLSIIYGDVEEPHNKNATSNSIGKTVLLKILNVILGAKNSGKDTIKGLKGYRVFSTIKYDNKFFNVELTIGNSRNYCISGREYNLTQYKDFFKIDRSFYSKQIMLEKRKNLLSSLGKSPTKDDISVVLKLLYLDGVDESFKKIKSLQEKIELISKYNSTFKDDISELEKSKFEMEMKKKKIDANLLETESKIKNLKISKDVSDISKKVIDIDKQIKYKSEILKLNNIKIQNFEEIIKDSKDKNISYSDIEKIYNSVNIEIPSLLKKNLNEVISFYDNLLKDKNSLYQEQIFELSKENKILEDEINSLSISFDNYSKIIADENLFQEALNIYNMYMSEKVEIDSKISEVNSKIEFFAKTKELKSTIDIYFNELEHNFEKCVDLINKYKEYVYELVNNIYGFNKNPYLNIGISNSSYKYKALPVNIDLSFDGDDGEGFATAKLLFFDFLIMKFTNEVDFLIEDSACFEAIDRRQISNILKEGAKIANLTGKQFIVSLNKYMFDDASEFQNYVVLTLKENDRLLNLDF